MTKEEIQTFHCPRWEELPDLPLYMDQVVLILEQSLGIFADEKERVVTSTMINNYVKHKLVSPPEKKKYGREQLAVLVLLSLLKKVLSMQEISGLIHLLTQEHGPQDGYNLFCARLEEILGRVFSQQGWFVKTDAHASTAATALDAALVAFASKLYFQKLVGAPAE